VTTTATVAGTRRYTGTFPADPAQVRHARAALAALLRDWPARRRRCPGRKAHRKL